MQNVQIGTESMKPNAPGLKRNANDPKWNAIKVTRIGADENPNVIGGKRLTNAECQFTTGDFEPTNTNCA
jgi:hypothetical protein